jgi:phosphopantothenoylcysteine decarboxylase/phosphopantothenate--cysteine ligase
MGLEIAKEAFIRGAEVTLIKGSTTVDIPTIFNVVEVESTDEMHDAVANLAADHDIFISAAAISDFKVKNSMMTKISSDEDIIIELERTPKIINRVKEINPGIFLVGFKAVHNLSDEELIEAAKKRMEESSADLMVANDVAREGAGFGSDENQVILIDDDIIEISLSPKWEIAKRIMDRIVEKI